MSTTPPGPEQPEEQPQPVTEPVTEPVTGRITGRITWRGPGDLIGGLPYVLGFHPSDSLAIVAIHPESDCLVGVARIDLPEPEDYHAVARALAERLLGRGPLRVILIVITPPARSDLPPPMPMPLPMLLPYRELVEECAVVFDEAGLRADEAWWAAACTAGAPWRSYQDPDHAGVVPDPESGTTAAYAVLAGSVTYASRDEMAALLAPAPDDVLARRAEVIASRAAERVPHRADPYLAYSLVDRAVRDAHTGVLPARDEDIAALALALRNTWVRDACLRYTTGEFRAGAQRLWQHLARATPGPDRAEPAVLWGMTAYLRGDTIAAGIAFDAALAAHPAHRLALLLTDAVQSGFPVTQLQAAVSGMFVAALDHIMQSAP